ncbi:ABC transporter ATP-binding protein [Salinibacterium sp. NSLL150]|uniref:ABC transporter ATP-binding protein n=1 Tax=unclassified Salinibacterium TaxID=2632331 RepID=UPI0018CE8902|nr:MULTISPECIES: ABC transporter ATP-binding protein [unclassified Salinibacterium]MBH0098515.1 ABC transporter ATP-binding protein [Salinibacterium sp. NSLL35]MBH0101270.1 ABC transporter ATP-binding protein [Salinibacterium sp. NSLL150]MBH0104029.1 ABC transporter ATP-binding protein [Salinibacterium sp. NSLL16]MBH0106790.1 ABC transporter ATP-binding protein [Salinibacterium sp. NSLL17]MBH0109438.1 ABC transporter ATP-binding protein [Salinibacterium sp. NG22]
MKSAIALVNEVLSILPAGARRYLIVYSVTLGLLSILDALALGLLALVISPILSGTTLSLPVLGEVGELGLLLMLGLVCLMIVAKGILAVALLWGATRRFAKYELDIGSRLFASYIDAPWVERLKRNSADVVRLTDGSVGVTVSGFLLPFSTLFGEALSFLTIVVVLAVVQPLVAAIALGYLGLLGAILYFWVAKRAREAGRVNLKYTLRSSRLITEMIGALKEVTLRGKSHEVADVVRSNRVHSTRARSNIQFLGQVPRYVLESGIVGGFVLVGIAGYATGGVTEAITAVALFGLAGFRMAPSVVRFQAVVSQVTANMPHASAVLAEIRSAESSVKYRVGRETLTLPEPSSALSFENVSFRYAADQGDAISDVSFTIPFGSTVALVGSSGAGKSTVVDLILGLIEPTGGRLAIDQVDLNKLTESWRQQVSYVPQEVALFDSSIAQNVALTWGDDFDEERVRSALAQAQLLDIVDKREDGINGVIGERGLALSGGQRQRLGIARALYADPRVLVLDEATSALDTATEAAVTDAIKALHGEKTVITVAHRLSTIQHADQILFMSNGKVVAQGTFSELVAKVPEFARQAGLAGLA